MRGTPEGCYLGCLAVGLIPTYAGNTLSFFTAVGCEGAHPHVCGEHLWLPRPRLAAPGSSPRMRGTQCLEFGAGAGGGLIPTYAGNTWPLNRRYAQPRAHPHVCGEHSSTQRTATRSPGSSPRVWGAPVRSLGCRSSSGLIPTCVGSTPLILITQFDIAAHPHVCGEHII